MYSFDRGRILLQGDNHLLRGNRNQWQCILMTFPLFDRYLHSTYTRYVAVMLGHHISGECLDMLPRQYLLRVRPWLCGGCGQ